MNEDDGYVDMFGASILTVDKEMDEIVYRDLDAVFPSMIGIKS